MTLSRSRISRICKTAEEKKQRSYVGTMAKLAPIYATKAVLGDLPRSMIKKTLEKRFAGKPTTGSIRKALKMTAAGGAMGIVTAPMLLKGLQLAGSDKKTDKAKGLGLIAGSGAAFQAVKGPSEAGRVGAVSRVLGKLPGSLGLGLAVASSLKKDKGVKSTKSDKYLKPALMAAGAGGIQGGVDKITRSLSGPGAKGMRMKKLKGLLGTSKGVKSMLPRVGAGAIAGGIGGLIAATVARKALKAMKDK